MLRSLRPKGRGGNEPREDGGSVRGVRVQEKASRKMKVQLSKILFAAVAVAFISV